MAKKTPPKSKYPKIIFVEDISAEKDFSDVLTSNSPERALGEDEDECEAAIYEFKRVVMLVRQSKIVVEEL